jgi:hypothetical protein
MKRATSHDFLDILELMKLLLLAEFDLTKMQHRDISNPPVLRLKPLEALFMVQLSKCFTTLW